MSTLPDRGEKLMSKVDQTQKAISVLNKRITEAKAKPSGVTLLLSLTCVLYYIRCDFVVIINVCSVLHQV